MSDDNPVIDETQARRALLHMLEDLEREREALQLAHRQWVDTVDAVREPMMVHDEKFRVVRANRAYAERAGMAFAALLGRPYWECFPKREGPLPACGENWKLPETSKGTQEEFALPSGETFVSRGYRMRDADSGRSLALHLFEDVTASRRDANALRKNHELLERIFDTAHFGIAYLDRDFNFIQVNRAYAEICRQAPEFFPGKNHFTLYPHAENEAIFRDVVASGRTFTVLAKPFDFPDQPARGTTYWDWTLHPLKNAAGTVEGLVFVLLDVTERTCAGRALARSNHALRTLSAGNTALVHATDEASLLREMCRIIVETGGYRSALVGYRRDDPAKSITLEASAGMDDAAFGAARLSWGGGELGGGALGLAIRTGEAHVIGDTRTDPRFAPWREAAERCGFRSVVALPLRGEGGAGIFGVLGIGAAEPFQKAELELLSELAGDVAYGILNLRAREENRVGADKLHHALQAMIEAIATTVEMRDPYTAGHQRRVAQLATAIAREMELPADRALGIHLAGTVHDLGKVSVPAEILVKPTRLSEVEFTLVKGHAQNGYEILKGVSFPWPIARMVREHHERLDGSGYPLGLKGEAILLESRILAVADVVEAMASHRPYRPGLGIDAALAEIVKGRGKVYHPEAVDACLRLFREKDFRFG